MAADSTLVNAAFKEGISRAGAVVPNMKPLIDSNIEIAKKTGDIITGLIGDIKDAEKTMRLGRDKQLAEFKKIADNGFKKLYEQKEPMPNKVVNALRDRIKELKEDFELVNTYGKNDNEENNDTRLRLMGELKRITNEIVDTRSDFELMLGTAGNWNKERINPENIPTYQSFLDIENMDANDDVSVDYPGGKLTFINSATGKQFTASQMKEGIPAMDKKMNTYGTGRFVDAGRRGASDGKENSYGYYDNDSVITSVKGGYLDEIVDEEDFMNAATIELASGTGTFKNDLLDYASISLEVIKNMYYTEEGDNVPIGEVFSKWDVVGDDGVVDAKDVAAINKLSAGEIEAFNVNHKRIVSALTNRYDPAFDLETSKELFADWAVDKEKQYYENYYNANIKRVDSSTLSKVDGQSRIGNNGKLYNAATGASEQVGSGYRLNKAGQVMYDDSDKLKKLKKHELVTDAFGNTYEPYEHVIEGVGMEVDFTKKGYIVRDSEGVPVMFDDEYENKTLIKEGKIYKTKEGYIFYVVDQARRNLVGTKLSIG
tara:strand:+ start:344 stop:1972 length:1629 start_codon:yes stop_codon:yes gene_type:complete